MEQLTKNSALAPYTTLFRSIIISEIHEQQIIVLKEVEGDRTFSIMIGIFEATSIDRREDADHDGEGAVALDRKSTRLNSSHVAMSYADFRLKKTTHKKQSCR